MHDEVTVHMNAAPEQVWALVSDITRTGEFSPETFEAEWLDGATGPAVGMTFRGHVNRNNSGLKYWTTCTIVTCDLDRDFAFTVGAGGQTVNTWRYQLAPSGDGTDVTESYQLTSSIAISLYWKLLGRFRGRTNRRGMTTTLERIKAVVEA